MSEDRPKAVKYNVTNLSFLLLSILTHVQGRVAVVDPLYQACSTKDATLVSTLLEAGADVDKFDVLVSVVFVSRCSSCQGTAVIVVVVVVVVVVIVVVVLVVLVVVVVLVLVLVVGVVVVVVVVVVVAIAAAAAAAADLFLLLFKLE